MTKRSFFSALATVTLLSACAVPGERAAADGGCPVGEMCSSGTPEGLWFTGASFFDDGWFDAGLNTMAVGGTQTINVLDSNGHSFNGFEAESTPPLAIDKLLRPNVIVRADGVGSGYLRILDPVTLDLYDRISLTAATIQSIRVIPQETNLFEVEGKANLEWALLAESNMSVGVALFGYNGDRLVDESLTVDGLDGVTVASNKSRWDSRSITVGSSDSANLTVTAGSGTSFSASFPIVTTIDDAETVKSTLSPDTMLSVAVKSEKIFCFRGFSQGRAVAGLEWSASTEGPLTIIAEESPCFTLRATAEGSATISVSAANFTKTFPVAITQNAVASQNQKTTAVSLPQPRGPHPGERADH